MYPAPGGGLVAKLFGHPTVASMSLDLQILGSVVSTPVDSQDFQACRGEDGPICRLKTIRRSLLEMYGTSHLGANLY
jgi:hypothetical protein